MPLRLPSRRGTVQTRKRLSPWAPILLAALLAGFITFLTWPTRVAITCEQLPELAALAICAATLFVFSVRSLAAQTRGHDRFLPAGATVLAGLAFFLSVHFVALYRAPCVAVQKNLHSR